MVSFVGVQWSLLLVLTGLIISYYGLNRYQLWRRVHNAERKQISDVEFGDWVIVTGTATDTAGVFTTPLTQTDTVSHVIGEHRGDTDAEAFEYKRVGATFKSGDHVNHTFSPFVIDDGTGEMWVDPRHWYGDTDPYIKSWSQPRPGIGFAVEADRYGSWESPDSIPDEVEQLVDGVDEFHGPEELEPDEWMPSTYYEWRIEPGDEITVVGRVDRGARGLPSISRRVGFVLTDDLDRVKEGIKRTGLYITGFGVSAIAAGFSLLILL